MLIYLVKYKIGVSSCKSTGIKLIIFGCAVSSLMFTLLEIPQQKYYEKIESLGSDG